MVGKHDDIILDWKLWMPTPLKLGTVGFDYVQENKEGKKISKIKCDALTLVESRDALETFGWSMKREDNRKLFMEKILCDDNERISFCGGTTNDLFSTPDLTLYETARAKLKSGTLLKKIIQKSILLRRRLRSVSEHDGDWDFDRKWEIKSFSRATRKPVKNRYVKIVASVDIAWKTNAKSISEYGSLIWGINDILESIGFNTDIVITNHATDLNGSGIFGGNGDIEADIEVNIKRAGQYVSPLNIARCLSSNFYRRAVFALLIKAPDNFDQKCSESLGRIKEYDYTVKFENGVLYLTPECIQTSSNDKVQEIILEAMEAA